MRRSLLALLAWFTLAPSQACELAGAERNELDGGIALLHRIDRPPLVVGRHFSVQFRVCGGAETLAPQRFDVDARMPAHNHGMNYRAAVETAADGLVEVTGLLFHMPGHWQMRVEFVVDGAIQQVDIDYRL